MLTFVRFSASHNGLPFVYFCYSMRILIAPSLKAVNLCPCLSSEEVVLQFIRMNVVRMNSGSLTPDRLEYHTVISVILLITRY